MSEETIAPEVRRFATQNDVVVWEGIPWGGATTLTPVSVSLDEFFAIARQVRALILYLDPDGRATAFARSGVIHVFATPGERARLTGEDFLGDEDAAIADDVESSLGFSIRMSGGQDHDDPYYDWRSGTKVSGRVRAAVEALVADQRFNGYRSGHVLAEYVADLDADDAQTVERVAIRVFGEGIGKQLDHRANQLLQLMVQEPSYDPLAWGPEVRTFLDEHIGEEDPRLVERLERSLSTYAYESGARTVAERVLTERATTVLAALSQSERDRLGFSSKNAAKLRVLETHLEGESDSRAERLGKEVARLEQERFGLSREERYATAARRLQAGGMTRAEMSRRLGVSTSILERIFMTHRRDVELRADDPIVTDLVPGDL